MNKRIIILGPSASGKSTLAKRLGEAALIPVFHLDQLYFSPNWIEGDWSILLEKIEKICATEEWIIEGNYSATLPARLARANTIIYLDRPTYLVFWRAITRVFRYYGTVRPDMAAGCPERFDWEFLHYVLTWNFRKHARMMELLDKYKASMDIIILKSDRAIDECILLAKREVIQ